MTYLLIQFDDIKSRKIKEAIFAKYNIKVVTVPKPILTPFSILNNLIKNGKPKIIIIRYLNDYPSLFKTTIRFLSEVISILISLMLNIKVIWICHNVDRESKRYHPKMSHLRRNLIAKYSYKILVTDPLLVNTAKEVFYKQRDKVEYITFGKENNFIETERSLKVTNKIIKFVEKNKKKYKNSNKRLLFTSCIGNPNDKNLSYERLKILLDESESYSYKIMAIVIGPLSNYYKKNKDPILTFLQNDPRVLFFDEEVYINEIKISKYIDFYWRIYNDYSVPYTVYHAANVKKPILTQNIGFLGDMVKEYNLGQVLDNDFYNLKNVLDLLQKRDMYNFNEFLVTHNWNIASQFIYNYIDKH